MLKGLLQKIIKEILIKKVVLLVKGSSTENYQRNLDQKDLCTRQRFFFTDNHRRNLDQKGSFTEKYRRNLDQKVFLNVKGSFTGQRFFYRKLSKKS